MACTCNAHNQEKYQQLDAVIAEYIDQPGSLINVLHKAQGIFGYLPEEVQAYIAEKMDVPLSEIYGVVTFYALFTTEPKGKYNFNICLGTACYVKGSGKILERVEQELGIKLNETSADGLFSIEACRCVGACGLAPVMTVNGEVYGRLTPDKVPAIIQKYKDLEANN